MAMFPRFRVSALAAALFALISLPAIAAAFSVDLSTERGHDAVYQPGEAIDVRVQSTVDAYLLVYEIDAEGGVHLIYPFDVRGGMVQGGRTYRLSEERPDFQLVVQGPVGQGYLVAVASREPFNPLPWYLRPYDPHAAELGYEEAPAEQRDSESEGVTQDGKIVGDPFVAMERIRRTVLGSPDDAESFATSYSGYYVHHEVRYPRYLCNDCHRPGYWSWWPGYDPYYATCSVFSVRVNYGWAWGPSYWFGTVPYYVYSWVPGCAPGYVVYPTRYVTSWYGWASWQRAWGMRRFKPHAPPGYIPPSKYDGEFRRRDASRALPPGFMAGAHQTRTRGGMVRSPVGASWRPTDDRGAGGDRQEVDRGNGDRGQGRGVRGQNPRGTRETAPNVRESGRSRTPAARAPNDNPSIRDGGRSRAPATRAPSNESPRSARSYQNGRQVSPRAPAARAPQSDAPRYERVADRRYEAPPVVQPGRGQRFEARSEPRHEARPQPSVRAPQPDAPRAPAHDYSPPSNSGGGGRSSAPARGDFSGGGGKVRR
jgi:Domain of unknown function (DUF4384)